MNSPGDRRIIPLQIHGAAQTPQGQRIKHDLALRSRFALAGRYRGPVGLDVVFQNDPTSLHSMLPRQRCCAIQ
jgi:hypothetical protein